MNSLLSEIDAAGTTPVYPKRGQLVVLPIEAQMRLAEQIAVAAIQVTDREGRLLAVRGRLNLLPEIALSAVSAWLQASIIVAGEAK